MKIAKIVLKDFRGFPGPAECEIPLDGKHFLLYGENGSGKSSLFHGLTETLLVQPGHFSAHKNQFSACAAADGFVRLEFDDGTAPFVLAGADANPPPAPPAFVAEAARRRVVMDYRSLLRTNFVHHDNADVNVFDLVTGVLLAHTENPITKSRLGDAWDTIRKAADVYQERQKTHAKRGKVAGNAELARKIGSQLNIFNGGLQALIPTLQQKANEILKDLTTALVITLDYSQVVTFNAADGSLAPQSLILTATFQGKPLPSHHKVLNEARLTAIGLAIYLASVLVTVPALAPGAPADLRLLVLDDVLIGLDCVNRLPLLKVIEKYFPDYQYVLMTYDRVWAEMVRLHTDETKWMQGELLARIGHDGIEMPVYRLQNEGPVQLIERARKHLADHDERAAVLYTRLAFERKLKKYCTKRSVPVPYDMDPRKQSSEDFWTAINATRPGAITGVSAADVEMHRKVILNEFTHASAVTITGPEIVAAIDTIAKLELK